MSDDFDKKEWQAQQEARDAMLKKQREKDKKAKARKARNAQRKIERLRVKLKENNDLTDWEEEFSESVTERLEKYGSAFADREKGGASDALSFAQKKIIATLNKKALGRNAGAGFKVKNGLKSKKPKFTPRVRQIDDDFEADTEEERVATGSSLPEKPKRPFLRVVSNKDVT